MIYDSFDVKLYVSQEVKVEVRFFLHPVAPTSSVEKTILSPFTFVKNQLTKHR